MDRRQFLQFATASSALILPSLSLAQVDYSQGRERNNRFIYDPDSLNKLHYMNQEQTIENAILPANSRKERKDFWDQPRRIFIKRERTGEVADLIYYKDGKLDPKQYWMASYLLRDVVQKKMVYMDPRLLDLICAVQAWVISYGYNGPIHIVSGFRTKKTNNSLEGAARNSMHLYGKAVDFRVPGLSISSLGKIAERFNAGGIGLYSGSGFIHIDTGGVRRWGR